jgi:hypothetical protein
MSILYENAYGEYIDFITSQPTIEQILDFRPSLHTQKRVRYLMNGKLQKSLTQEEILELEEYYKATRFLHQLKQRAQRRLETLQ